VKILAKFQVSKVSFTKGPDVNAPPSQEVLLHPVTRDGIEEHEKFHRYTPSGELRLFIDNPAIAPLKPGAFFYVELTQAEEPKQ